MLRTWLAVMMFVLLVPALVVANASTWALQTLIDDDTFASTVGTTLDAPALEAAVADAIADVVMERIQGIDPQFRAAALPRLGLAADASTSEIRDWVDGRVLVALRSPDVEDARDRLVAELHQALIDTVDDSGPVRVQGDSLTIDAGAVYEQAIDRLHPEAQRLVAPAPGDAVLVVAEAQEFRTVQQAMQVMRAVGIVIPLVVLATVAVVLVLAHRRVRALSLVGVAVLVAGLVSLAAVWFLPDLIGGMPAGAEARSVAHDVTEAFLSRLATQSVLLIVTGTLIAIVGWIVVRVRRRPGRTPAHRPA